MARINWNGFASAAHYSMLLQKFGKSNLKVRVEGIRTLEY